MDFISQKIEELQQKYPVLRDIRIPIDIFSFFELDLRLKPISFPDLTLKYDVEAAICADFQSIYVDAEQYDLMENGPLWKLNRLRFTIAHELAHYFLHRNIPRKIDFSSPDAFASWSETYNGQKYMIEQEANEFAGSLLVPKKRLESFFDQFADKIEKRIPDFMRDEKLRAQFAQSVSQKFMVNSQVIEVRLDRDQIWPVS